MFLKPWHFLFPFPHGAHRPSPAAPRPLPTCPHGPSDRIPSDPDPTPRLHPQIAALHRRAQRGPGDAPWKTHGQSPPRALRDPGTEGGDPALSRELKATPRRRAALTYRSGQLLPGLRHLHGDIRSTAGPLGGPGAWRGGPGRAGPGRAGQGKTGGAVATALPGRRALTAASRPQPAAAFEPGEARRALSRPLPGPSHLQR